MTIASRKTALASARPKSLRTRSSSIAKEAKTTTMTAAAAVITRPVSASPSRTAARASRAVQPLLVDAGDEEDLVVHREPEHDREEHHGDEGVDRPGLDAEQAGEPAALEDRLDDAERRADREQVHRRAACSGISSERKTTSSRSAESSDDDADEERQLAREDVREVDARRGAPPM